MSHLSSPSTFISHSVLPLSLLLWTDKQLFLWSTHDVWALDTPDPLKLFYHICQTCFKRHVSSIVQPV